MTPHSPTDSFLGYVEGFINYSPATLRPGRDLRVSYETPKHALNSHYLGIAIRIAAAHHSESNRDIAVSSQALKHDANSSSNYPTSRSLTHKLTNSSEQSKTLRDKPTPKKAQQNPSPKRATHYPFEPLNSTAHLDPPTHPRPHIAHHPAQMRAQHVRAGHEGSSIPPINPTSHFNSPEQSSGISLTQRHLFPTQFRDAMRRAHCPPNLGSNMSIS
ncbi:hypothetical protein F5Y18DRAFT_430011 [Xylariaceae sp. FL1019]|nr:hypothetical protein F5Y18DRAFT_430011 [Xylariaceae sp. FL1019]